jgi:transposase-like protein
LFVGGQSTVVLLEGVFSGRPLLNRLAVLSALTPETMHRHIQTTNAIESLFSNVRQRADQIDVFTTETSCLTIVWAIIQDIHFHKISV